MGEGRPRDPIAPCNYSGEVLPGIYGLHLRTDKQEEIKELFNGSNHQFNHGNANTDHSYISVKNRDHDPCHSADMPEHGKAERQSI